MLIYIRLAFLGGNITLASASPFQHPVIHGGVWSYRIFQIFFAISVSTSDFLHLTCHDTVEILNNEFDIYLFRQALRVVREFMGKALGLKAIKPTERGEHAGLEEDGDIDHVIRERLWVTSTYKTISMLIELISTHHNVFRFSVWHPSCTTAVGTVLDSNFIVKGVRNLRVVDAGSMVRIIFFYKAALRVVETNLDLDSIAYHRPRASNGYACE